MESTANTYPTRGWEYLSMEDTKEGEDYDSELTERCQYCGTLLRYRHHLRHPDGLHIFVGAQCADLLTQSYTATTAEAEHKRDMQHIRTLINSTRWKVRKNGHFIMYRDSKIAIWDNRNNYHYVVSGLREGIWRDYYDGYRKTFNNAVEAAYFAIKRL